MSNIIFALASGIVLGLHYGGRLGQLSSPALYLNILLFLVCLFWFLRENQERHQARYFRVELGADDVVAVLYVFCMVFAWLKSYVPQTASGLKWLGILNIVGAIVAYLAWAGWRQVGQEREREEWEEKIRRKYRVRG